MRINKYFRLQEFLPKEIFSLRGWAGITLLDSRILYSAYEIRRYCGPGYQMIVNNWLWDANGFEYRAFRPNSFTGGAVYSQHRFGRAIDFDLWKNGNRIDPSEVNALVRSMKSKNQLKPITAMEVGVNWTHIDCRFSRYGDKLIIFNGNKKSS